MKLAAGKSADCTVPLKRLIYSNIAVTQKAKYFNTATT